MGSEFFSRSKPDSNSVWLTEQLEYRGVRVLAKHIVADDVVGMAAILEQALHRVDLVVTTGGLGPTDDDRTRQAVAKACGCQLVFHQDIVDDIAEKFKKRGRTMPPNNEQQAYIPESARVIANPSGTAPGFWLSSHSGHLLVLPGPPSEMSELYGDFCKLAEDLFPTDSVVVRGRVLKVAGLGESDMDSRIVDLYQGRQNPELTINFSASDIEIHLTARAGSPQAADALLDPLVSQIAQRLGVHLFSTHGETLAQVVIARLKEFSLTVATAESLTAGMVCDRLASVPGASQVLLGGVVAYSPRAKQSLLDVDPATIERDSVVSASVAEEMAHGVWALLGSDIGLSCTGWAGPEGGTLSDPIGTAYLGLCYRGTTSSMRVSVPGDRERIRERVAQIMMFWLYEKLELEPTTFDPSSLA